MRLLKYTMFITNNRTSFHLWWKENLVKHWKVSKYYETDCSLFKITVIYRPIFYNFQTQPLQGVLNIFQKFLGKHLPLRLWWFPVNFWQKVFDRATVGDCFFTLWGLFEFCKAFQRTFFNPLTTNVSHHIETSQLIFNANQLIGFYTIENIGC